MGRVREPTKVNGKKLALLLVVIALMTVGRAATANQATESKPTIEEARTALVRLVETKLQQQIAAHVSVEEAKRLADFLKAKERVEQLKNDKATRYEKIPGYVFVGGWAIGIDEPKFYVVIPMRTELIYVKGRFQMANGKGWEASIREIA